MLNKRSRDPPGVGVSGKCALESSCTRSTPGGTSGTGSALNPVWVSSAENPVPNVPFARLLRERRLGLPGPVLNVLFMVVSKNGVASLSWILVGLEGSLIQDSFFYVGVPNVSASVFSIERCDLPAVKATDRQSHLTGHLSRLPLDWTFKFGWSYQLPPRQHLLCLSTSSRPCWFFSISSSDRAQRHASLSSHRSPMLSFHYSNSLPITFTASHPAFSTMSCIQGITFLFMLSIVTEVSICCTFRLHLQSECTMSSLFAPKTNLSTIRVRFMMDRLLFPETFANTLAHLWMNKVHRTQLLKERNFLAVRALDFFCLWSSQRACCTC